MFSWQRPIGEIRNFKPLTWLALKDLFNYGSIRFKHAKIRRI